MPWVVQYSLMQNSVEPVQLALWLLDLLLQYYNIIDHGLGPMFATGYRTVLKFKTLPSSMLEQNLPLLMQQHGVM